MHTADSFIVDTPHGRLAGAARGQGEPAILCIHGNSFCKEIFEHILASNVTSTNRVILFDLPGHGGSENALGKFSLLGRFTAYLRFQKVQSCSNLLFSPNVPWNSAVLR
jgi:pimeloyl-ACP methyl ester carboxylesterase